MNREAEETMGDGSTILAHQSLKAE